MSKISKSCKNCGDEKCKSDNKIKCNDYFTHWKKKKECQINAIERHEFAGCQLQCIVGYDCVHYR